VHAQARAGAYRLRRGPLGPRHAESVGSRFHLERIARLRGDTHGDFRRPAMNSYRARLARLRC